MDYFAGKADAIRAWLGAFLERAAASFSPLAPIGPDACRRLLDYARPGKLIRGGLVSLGRDLWTGAPEGGEDPALSVGAAMELAQSAFLIHDDIMDRDDLRRGKPSLHAQYRSAAEAEALPDAAHYGESMAICAGDAALFLSFSLLGSSGLPPALASHCAREFTAVTLGQMMDVRAGTDPGMPSEEDVLRVYTWKTGRYSFALPLQAGAMLAGRGAGDLAALERLGVSLGLAFQMRDDELGLFGDPAETGKPLGSDMREGKKTLLILLAHQALDEGGRRELLSVLGRRDAEEAVLAKAASLVEASGARGVLALRMEAALSEARAILASLDGADPQALGVLGDLADFCVTRRK